jgi:glycerophosphoryl diester phosphodiesterase
MHDLKEVVSGALKDFRALWRSLAWTDMAYKLLAFAILSPATALFLRGLIVRADKTVLTDVEIAHFFVATPEGWLGLLLGGAFVVTIALLEGTCLMGIGFAWKEGSWLRPRRALAFGVSKALPALRLAFHAVVRVLFGVAPFALALGAIYGLFMGSHDINYYLARHPKGFWFAAVLAGVVLLGLAALLLRTACRWVFALPLVIFEGTSPRKALGESAARSTGRHGVIGAALVGWFLGALLLAYAPTGLIHLAGRTLAPRFAGSLALLLAFMAAMVLIWSVLTLAAAVFNASSLSLLLNRMYFHLGDPRSPKGPEGETGALDLRLSRKVALGIALLAIPAAIGVALLVFLVTRQHHSPVVIAHRGASLEAPENTLSAFQKAAEEGTDFVELDVQESADGEVLVVHDSDLMKVAGSPLKIWLATFAELRGVDLGSRVDPKFAGEKVPTLAEALETCKGKARMVVELKSYGHNQNLEEKVVALVEAAGMERDCIFMSLDHEMIRTMKALRPNWRCGILVAKAVGDLTTLDCDFLAVEARIATARFIRKAHRAGRDVYVWTLDDPAWMVTALAFGSDGLITDKPALARKVIARWEEMSDAQRLVAALMVRWGARAEDLAAEDALRP